jgi:DNA adenine methylase
MEHKGMMKPPIKYYGGKSYQAAWILDVIKRYKFKTYVEPFGGSGAILFAKEPSPVEIYNDIFSDLVTFYRVLRNPKSYKDLIIFLEHSPYSREMFGESKDALASKKLSPVERAGHFFITIRQSFLCVRRSWSSAGKVGKPISTPYRKAIDRLPEIHERLRHVHIEHKDAIECIKLYADSKSLIYCDPPYVSATRVSPDAYKHEYTDEQHKQLLETLLTVPGHKVLSGYQSPIYDPLLDAGWTLHKKQFTCLASPNKKDRRMECLYSSPMETTTQETKHEHELFGRMGLGK